MSPAAALANFKTVLDAPARIGITELSRNSESWRSRLAADGLLEVTDRSGTAAYLLSRDSMQAITDAFAEQEREIEALSLEAMFETRGAQGQWMSGENLADAAADAFRKRFGAEEAAL